MVACGLFYISLPAVYRYVVSVVQQVGIPLHWSEVCGVKSHKRSYFLSEHLAHAAYAAYELVYLLLGVI